MSKNTFSVGNAQVIRLVDAEVDYPFPLNQLFPDVPAEAWTGYEKQYPGMLGGPNKSHTPCSSYLLRSQGRTILVDTGAGPGPDEAEPLGIPSAGLRAGFGRGPGRLLEELKKAGFRPDDIDTVFFTHLHPGHVGWNLTRQSDGTIRPTFPRARYLVHQADWDYFLKPEVRAHLPFSYVEKTIRPLEDLGVLELLTGDRALNRELTAIPSPGHTPGHMSLAINSSGQRVVIAGDVAIHPAQVTEVGWGHIFEADQKQAAETRQRLFDQWEEESVTLAMGHFPSPGFGKLARVRGRRYWQGM